MRTRETSFTFFADFIFPASLPFYGKMELKDRRGITRRGRERNKRNKKKEKLNKIMNKKLQEKNSKKTTRFKRVDFTYQHKYDCELLGR